MDRALTVIATASRVVAGLFLLAAGAGALSRHPVINPFSEADDVAVLLRLAGSAWAIVAGVLSLKPLGRLPSDAVVFSFVQFLAFASIFGVVVKRSPFNKAMVIALSLAWILETARRARGGAARANPEALKGPS